MCNTLCANFCTVQTQFSDWRSNTTVITIYCENVLSFPLQVIMSGNYSSLFTAAVSKKDKRKNQVKVGKQKNKGDCD